jgi:hypothetical protein
LGAKQDKVSDLKKPLANELCSIRARANLKAAEQKGEHALCDSCEVKKYAICRATGHAICSKRKDIGWIPVPFSNDECGLYIAKAVQAA